MSFRLDFTYTGFHFILFQFQFQVLRRSIYLCECSKTSRCQDTWRGSDGDGGRPLNPAVRTVVAL